MNETRGIHTACESHPGDFARNKSALTREHRHVHSCEFSALFVLFCNWNIEKMKLKLT